MSLHATRARPPAVAATADVHWSRRGRCGPDTADWFVRTGHVLSEDNVAALMLCEFCPVKAKCAEHILGLDHQERPMLIAGGLVFNEGGQVMDPPMPSPRSRREEPETKPPRECRWCREEFTGKTNQCYCSPSCRRAFHRFTDTYEGRTYKAAELASLPRCRHCKRPYEATQVHQRYCSRSCRWDANNASREHTGKPPGRRRAPAYDVGVAT